MYRAASFWGRVYAPEKMLGMSTGDELEDVFNTSRAIQDAEIVDAPSAEAVKAALEQAEAQAATPEDIKIHGPSCPANIGETCDCGITTEVVQ
jgi:hypothetical protein